jgi:hypothetical protein
MDARSVPDKEVTPLRQQALEWLHADLEGLARVAAQNDPVRNQEVRYRLGRWRRDADLAPVRDEKALARLPETERAAWRKLWREVAELQKKVGE